MLHLNDFKTKSKLKWTVQSKENTKLFTQSHDMIETTWMFESSILFLLGTDFLTWNHAYFIKPNQCMSMWLIFVVPTWNYLFYFFLKFWLWKHLTYMLFIWGLNIYTCAQVNELPKSHSGDNRKVTLFSWMHINYAHLAFVRFEH